MNDVKCCHYMLVETRRKILLNMSLDGLVRFPHNVKVSTLSLKTEPKLPRVAKTKLKIKRARALQTLENAKHSKFDQKKILMDRTMRTR